MPNKFTPSECRAFCVACTLATTMKDCHSCAFFVTFVTPPATPSEDTIKIKEETMKDICKNCRGWKGLHHFETNQCPVNGTESPIGKKQEWQESTYAEDDGKDEHIAELESAVRTLSAHLEAILQITERDDMSDRRTQKAIRRHAEAFNLLETIDFVTARKP